MPKWSKQTYNMVADHLAAANSAALEASGQYRAGAQYFIGKLSEAFAITFEEDNPRFNRERFVKATYK